MPSRDGSGRSQRENRRPASAEPTPSREAAIPYEDPLEVNLAIQVSYSIDDSATYEREVGGMVKFLKAYKQYRGIIVAWDTERQITEDGITIDVVPVWKWLLQ